MKGFKNLTLKRILKKHQDNPADGESSQNHRNKNNTKEYIQHTNSEKHHAKTIRQK